MNLIYGWLIALLLTGGIVTTGYFYYKHTQAEILALNQQVLVLEQAQEENIETINQMSRERDATAKALASLGIRVRAAEQYQDDLLELLHKHDLTKLVSEKPGLTGKVINEGIDKVFADIESLTDTQ